MVQYLKDIDEVYNEIFERGRLPYLTATLSRFVHNYRLAEIFIEYKNEMAKPDSARKSLYTEKNETQLLAAIDKLV
jgi:hypothetical protein